MAYETKNKKNKQKDPIMNLSQTKNNTLNSLYCSQKNTC